MRGIAALLLLAASSAGAVEHRFTAWAGAETWNDDLRPFHGAAILAYDLSGLPRGASLGVEYNTDTLRVTYSGLQLTDRLELNFGLTGEFFLAGLLRDYWQDAHTIEDRVFLGSYALAFGALKARVLERTYFELVLAGRKWFFSEADTTGDAFELPPDVWVFEPRVRYTWWWLDHDLAWQDRHRPYARLNGIAVGAEFGLDLRSESGPWGARDAAAFTPVDPRNDPEQVIIRGRQWALAGWQMHPVVRTQLAEYAAFGRGEDDLTRDRIGGLNPYSVPLVGAPWAGWLSEEYVAGMWSWHFKVVGDLEIGPLATVVGLEDVGRVGSDEWDVLWGVGGLVDWRYGGWQVDLRGGYSPAVQDRSDRAAYSVWISAGWAGWW